MLSITIVNYNKIRVNDLERIKQYANTVNYSENKLLLELDSTNFSKTFFIINKYRNGKRDVEITAFN